MNLNQLDNAPGGRAITGQMGMADVEALNKALSAGYGTDSSSLTGGGALRIQSLDKTLMAVIQENKHFALFNALPKQGAGATVDEWTEQSGVGGFMGGSTNTELGIIQDATGDYARRVGFVKYLMTKRQVSLVQTLQGAIIEAETVEQQNGAKQLLTDAEFLCFEGDSTVVPSEFDGIRTQVASLSSTDHIIDAGAQPLTSVNAIAQAAATIAGFGNFGTPTDLFMAPATGADLDVNLDPAYRALLQGGQEAKLGTPVRGIVTAQGDIKVNRDVFIRDQAQKTPFELRYSAIAAANAFTPASCDVAHTNDAASAFGAVHAGNYYYLVTGVNANGQSTGFISAQVPVAQGDKVTLTIGASVGGTETGYVVYRSRKGGTNAPADFREMGRVAKTGASTTYVDYNRDIPGTTSAYMLNMTAGDSAITWRQLLPMMKFPLATTNQAVIPWAQLLFGYLRITKRQHHVVIKNILTNQAKAVWNPFG